MIYASSVYWISTVLQPCDFNLILSMPLPLARRTNFISSCFTFPWDHWCSSLYTHSLGLFHKPQFTPKPIYLFSMYHFSLAWSDSFHWYSRMLLWILHSLLYSCYFIQFYKAFLSHLLQNNALLKLHFYSSVTLQILRKRLLKCCYTYNKYLEHYLKQSEQSAYLSFSQQLSAIILRSLTLSLVNGDCLISGKRNASSSSCNCLDLYWRPLVLN